VSATGACNDHHVESALSLYQVALSRRKPVPTFLESAPSGIQTARQSNPAPERDQEKWPSGFPVKSCDQQRSWSGPQTVALTPEVIPL